MEDKVKLRQIDLYFGESVITIKIENDKCTLEEYHDRDVKK